MNTSGLILFFAKLLVCILFFTTTARSMKRIDSQGLLSSYNECTHQLETLQREAQDLNWKLNKFLSRNRFLDSQTKGLMRRIGGTYGVPPEKLPKKSDIEVLIGSKLWNLFSEESKSAEAKEKNQLVGVLLWINKKKGNAHQRRFLRYYCMNPQKTTKFLNGKMKNNEYKNSFF